MNIEMDPRQVAVLRNLIDHRLSNLSSEIRHTDAPAFRQELRDEREVLRGLQVLLPTDAEPQEASG